MRTGMLVFAFTASGIVGGVVGALLAGSGAAGPEAGAVGPAPGRGPAAAASPSPTRALDDLRNRIGALEGNLTVNSEETARLRTALAEETKGSAALREKIASLEAGGGLQAPPGMIRFGGPRGEGFQTSGEAAALAPMAFALPERFRKAAELRGLPEEERWGKARDALGLTSYQEEELKAAVKERAEAMKGAMSVSTAESSDAGGNGSTAVTIAMPDLEKVREARRKYDERVGKTLNAEQAKTWREEGYEQAMGGGGGVSFVSAATIDVGVGGGEGGGK